MTSNLNYVQKHLKPWQEHNFPDRPDWQPLLGIGEEVGELNHAFLKRAQDIRGSADAHTLAIKDALGDILIFMCDFANSQGLNLENILADTWMEVSLRNWRPEKGDLPTEVFV